MDNYSTYADINQKWAEQQRQLAQDYSNGVEGVTVRNGLYYRERKAHRAVEQAHQELTKRYGYSQDTRGITRQEMGDHLNTLPWDWFFTGTFRSADVVNESAVKSFFAWYNNLCFTKNINGGYFYCLEYGKGGRDVPHIHALLYLPGTERSKRLSEFWKVWFTHYGRAEILKYEKEKGAGFYLTKYVVKEIFKRGGWSIEHPTPPGGLTADT
jgi:hypothetical protein